jgi:PAS domain S-box-containing protein
LTRIKAGVNYEAVKGIWCLVPNTDVAFFIAAIREQDRLMRNRLFIILAATVAAVFFGFLFIQRPERTLVNPSLHSTMEAVEALSVLLMALFLLARKEEDPSGNSALLGLGFLGMGILNSAHAASGAGEQLVFLRAVASLSGGLGFALVWLPERYKRSFYRTSLVWTVAAGGLLLGAASFLLPAALPAMLQGSQFTYAAIGINLLAGLLFITGAVRIARSLYHTHALEDQLFSMTGMFFGLAGLTFPYSMLWSESWWYWHALRLIGSLLVLGLVVYRHLQTVATLSASLIERKRTEQSLRLSFELTKTIINSMHDSISLLDVRDFRIIGVNSSFLKEYGYSDEAEVLGKHCYEITHHRSDVCAPPDDICPLIETVRSGRHFSVDHVHYGSGGEKKFVEVSTVPIKDEEGNVIQVVHVSRDVTERKHAEQEREQLLSDIARSNKDLEQFASIASHDLKEPLRMVSSYVQLLERKYKGRLDNKADTYIRFAVEGVDRMQQLIEGLLAYSRITRGAAQFGPVDTNRVFSLAVTNLSEAIAECHAAVTRADLPVVLGDETQLLQLFQNLIANAIKYRKPDTQPQVHVSSAREGNSFILSVQDNGIGIDPKEHDRVFQIFQRLHSHDEYSGAGIGLAVCKRIVERHYGRIWIESDPGAGSRFNFTLPDKSDQSAKESKK